VISSSPRTTSFWETAASRTTSAEGQGISPAAGASPSPAYELTSIDTPFPQFTGRFGERHAATDDIDGDGVNDYFVAALSEDVGPFTNAGRVYAISGRTRAVIYNILSPAIQTNAAFGFFIAVLGDVNADGRRDIAVGTDSQDTTAAGDSCTVGARGATMARARRGSSAAGTGRSSMPWTTPAPRRAPASDRGSAAPGTSRATGCPSRSSAPRTTTCRRVAAQTALWSRVAARTRGQAFIFNGQNGALVQTLDLPASDQIPATCSSSCGGLGLSVQGPGDVDGDGVTDQLVNAGSLNVTAAGQVCPSDGAGGTCNEGQGAMYLFSGDENGKLLARIDDPVPQTAAVFGFQDAGLLSPGDVNNDGRADLFGNGF